MNNKTWLAGFGGLLLGLSVWCHAGDADVAPSAAWRGFTEAGQRAYTDRRYDEAADYFRRAMREASEYGGMGRALAVSLNNLTLVYVTQGRYDAAEPLQRRSISMIEQLLGDDHPDVAVGLVNLARIEVALKKFGEAEPLLARALEIRRTRFGPDHPSVASVIGNMGQLKAAQGRHEEAAGEFQKAISLAEKAQGGRHPNLAPMMEAHIQTLEALGRHDESETYRRRLEKLRK